MGKKGTPYSLRSTTQREKEKERERRLTACRMQKHAGAFVGTAAGPRQQRLVQRQTRQSQTSISLRREGGSVSTGPRRIVCQSSRGKSDGSFWGGFLIGGT